MKQVQRWYNEVFLSITETLIVYFFFLYLSEQEFLGSVNSDWQVEDDEDVYIGEIDPGRALVQLFLFLVILFYYLLFFFCIFL